jgi:MFS family permease
MVRLDRKSFIRIMTDWKIYSAFVMFFCIAVSLNSSAFTPSIVADLGHSDAEAQALTAPIYIVAGMLGFVTALFADKMGNRFVVPFFSAILGIGGLVLFLNGHTFSPRIQYAALYLFIGGCFVTVPSQVVWASNNMGGHYKQGFCTAVQIGLGSTGAFVPLITFIPSDAPAYTRAFRICLSLTILAALVMVLTEVGLWWENRQRKAGKRDWRLQLPEDEVTNLGDDHPHFRFTY